MHCFIVTYTYWEDKQACQYLPWYPWHGFYTPGPFWTILWLAVNHIMSERNDFLKCSTTHKYIYLYWVGNINSCPEKQNYGMKISLCTVFYNFLILCQVGLSSMTPFLVNGKYKLWWKGSYWAQVLPPSLPFSLVLGMLRYVYTMKLIHSNYFSWA